MIQIKFIGMLLVAASMIACSVALPRNPATTVLTRVLVIERATGSVVIADAASLQVDCRVEGLGDLSHASAVFGRSGRYAYVFGRDGGLSKVDMLLCRIDKRVVQSGNAIGGAVSQKGDLIAVSNYTPGGVRFFDPDTLALRGEIAAEFGPDRKLSKTVGLVDIPGNRFAYALFDGSEIQIAAIKNGTPQVQKFASGNRPYDGIVTPDGRYYLAGLFGEPGVDVIDLWQTPLQVRRVLPDFAREGVDLPVYKMPHFEGISYAGGLLYMPAVKRHEVWGVDPRSWDVQRRIPVLGQPVFTVAQPDGRRIWVNFAMPDNQNLQVIDALEGTVLKSWAPGKGVLHIEFTGRGDQAWVSVRDANRVEIYDTETLQKIGEFSAQAPSGIFMMHRASRIGQ